jgi:hypothetical protein
MIYALKLVLVRGRKNSSFASEELASVRELANVLFCAVGVVIKYCTKQQLPIRAKVRGEK